MPITPEGFARKLEAGRFQRYGLSQEQFEKAAAIIVEAVEDEAERSRMLWLFDARSASLILNALKLYPTLDFHVAKEPRP